MLIESTAASRVGIMIQLRLRCSACQIVRRSRSPDSGAALKVVGAGLEVAGAALNIADAAWKIASAALGAVAAAFTAALSLLARQNAKRIARPRYRHLAQLPVITLH